MSEREFWWASYKDGSLQVVEIGRVDGQLDWCCFTGTDWNLNAPLDDLRLVEPVLPPGRVAQVTERLEDIVASWDIDQMTVDAKEVLAILQGEAAAVA